MVDTSIPKRIELTVFDESESEEFLSFSADFSQFVAGSHLPQVFQLPHHCDTYYNHLDLEVCGKRARFACGCSVDCLRFPVVHFSRTAKRRSLTSSV